MTYAFSATSPIFIQVKFYEAVQRPPFVNMRDRWLHEFGRDEINRKDKSLLAHGRR
jgi:hypothetical protein